MKRHTIKEWIFAMRPWSTPASAMPIIVTLAYLFYKGYSINWLLGLLTLAGMVIFHFTGNLWSDYFDFVNKVDTESTPGATTLTSGAFQPKEIRNFAIIMLLTGIAIGLIVTAMTSITLLYIGIIGAALAILYPLLKYNAFGDIDIIITFSILPMAGTSLIMTGAIDWNVMWIALPIGLITDAILHSNNTRDMETDRHARIKTMAMQLGSRGAAALYGFEVIFPYVWISVLSLAGILPYSTVFIFLTLPVAIGCAKTMKNSVHGGKKMIADIDVRTANLQLMFSTILSICLIIARFI